MIIVFKIVDFFLSLHLSSFCLLCVILSLYRPHNLSPSTRVAQLVTPQALFTLFGMHYFTFLSPYPFNPLTKLPPNPILYCPNTTSILTLTIPQILDHPPSPLPIFADHCPVSSFATCYSKKLHQTLNTLNWNIMPVKSLEKTKNT